MRKAIYLYDACGMYKGLPEGSDMYKELRLKYLNAYRDAIMDNNIWNEKHYFQKLLTCIAYENFSENIASRLENVFRKRAEYWSLFLLQFCDSINRDETLDQKEKRDMVVSTPYKFRTNPVTSVFHTRILYDDVKKIFKMYQYKGYASEKDISNYKECLYLYRYSKMEEKMADYFAASSYDCSFQKTFDDLVSPTGTPLRFDGCVRKGNKIFLFECQGLQHYKPVELFGGEEGFVKRRRYDSIKKDWCKAHNIPLLCIKYSSDVSACIKQFMSRKEYSKIVYEL